MDFLRLLAPLAVVSAFFEGMVPGSIPSPHESRVAAEVAVMALRASVGQRVSTDSVEWVMLPDHRVVNRDELVELLELAPKPVECRAMLVADALSVTCGPITDDNALERHRDIESRAVQQGRQFLQTRVGALDDLSLLVVRSVGDTLVAPLRTIEAFFMTYRIYGHASFLGEPDEDAHARGAIAVLKFSSTSEMTGELELPSR